MATGGDPVPWDKTNPHEQKIIRVSTDPYPRSINKLLIERRPHLMQIINPLHLELWPRLRSLYVVDSRELEELKFNSTAHEQVERLLEHLERGPTWRFHALLRACALTGQEHVITDLGFDPNVYASAEENPTSGSEPSSERTSKVRLSGQLLRAIRDHCRACQQKLMRTNLFDFDCDPNAEVLDVAEYFVQVDMQTKQTTRLNKGCLVKIPEDRILRAFNGQPSPQAARLDGAPGTGKTTFLKHIVHKWSKEFLELQGDDISLDTENKQYSTMVYLHIRSIKGSVREAIRNALWCREQDKDVLMDHVESGEGVAVVIDALDELRDKTVIKELQDYVDKHTGGRQKVLISSRPDLCRIKQSNFDRFLVLEGFNLTQAMDYVKSYFPPGPPGSKPHSILTYIMRHQEKLEPILTNPLRLHILCELTSRGILDLKPDQTLDVQALFRPLEKYLIRRESEKKYQHTVYHQITARDEEQFYRLCLFGMLSDIREFTQKHLDDFKINKLYRDSFLTPNIELGLDGQSERYFTFGHEMLYEYFAASYIHRASEEDLKPLLLAICSQKSLRNVQKIVCEILCRKEIKKENLLEGTIRAILIFQYNWKTSKQTCDEIPFMEKVQQLKLSISSDSCIEQLFLSQVDKHRVRQASELWDTINNIFDHQSDELRRIGWFNNIEESGVIAHVLGCLQSYPQHQQEEVILRTVRRLLPSTGISRSRSMVGSWYPAGPARWGYVESGPFYKVSAWCPEDMSEVLKASEADEHALITLTRTFGNHLNFISDLWGEPQDSCWSQQAWRGLLDHLITSKLLKDYPKWTDIHLPRTAPLGGLVSCLRSMHVSFGNLTLIGGRATLEEVEGWLDWWEFGKGSVTLQTDIVLPSGVSETSLRARADRLRQMLPTRYRRTVYVRQWITETGEKHTLDDKFKE